jgi:sensor histidine kinase YesM
LDLTEWNFERDGNVRLNGQWEFYEKQLLTPEDFMQGAKRPVLKGSVKVPGQWNDNSVYGAKWDGQDYGTVRLKVQMPRGSEGIYGIKTFNIRTAHQLFINSEQVGSSGKPGIDRAATHPDNIPYICFFQQKGENLEVIIQVANFHYVSGGIIQAIMLGDQHEISKLRETRVAMDLFTAVGILLTSLYFFALYLAHKEDKAVLNFGIYLVMFGVFILTHGERLFANWLPGLDYEWFYKLQYISAIGAQFFLTAYLYYLYPKLVSRRIIWLLQAGLAVIFLAVLTTNVWVSSILDVPFILWYALMFTYLLFILLKALRQQAKGAQLFLVGALCLISNFIVYVLSIEGLMDVFFSPPLETLLFVLSQAFLLMERFFDAYWTIAELSQRLIVMDMLKNEFLTRTSHQLKGPLKVLLNISQTLLNGARGTLTSLQDESITLVAMIGQRLFRLVDDILVYSRLVHKDVDLQTKCIDIYSCTRLITEILQHDYFHETNKVRFVNAISPEKFYVEADEDRLKQILFNLVENAFKYTTDGEIILAASIRGDWVEVSIKDTGIGIDPDKLEQIFTGLNPEMTGPENQIGMGLGLPITKKLLELHGGRLLVQSRLNEGSVFTFTLPGCKAVDKEKTEAKPTAPGEVSRPAPDGPIPDRGEETIVIVDNDKAELNILTSVLTMEGYEVLVETYGKRVIDLLEQNRLVSLVIMDLTLGDMSGYEACKKIREKYSMAEVPILMLTTRIGVNETKMSLAAGANDNLGRPYDLDELIARVRNLVQLRSSVQTVVKTEMAFLQAQIKPHFIFNSLNTVSSFCETDPLLAANLLDEFSNYLRMSFDFSNLNDFIPLEREISLVKSYLTLEKARFGEKLNIFYELDERAFSENVPPLILQPIVENAVKHGLLSKKEGGNLYIRVGLKTNQLVMSVEDDGVGVKPGKVAALSVGDGQGKGVGLKNINKRLRALYGLNIEIDSEKGRGTCVTIRIPAQGGDADDSGSHRG